MDWFLYDRVLRHGKVKETLLYGVKHVTMETMELDKKTTVKVRM